MSVDKFPQHVAIINNYNIFLQYYITWISYPPFWLKWSSDLSAVNREANSSLLPLPEEVCVERGPLWVHFTLIIVPTAISWTHRAKACTQNCCCSHCKGPVLTEECFVDPSTDFLWIEDFFICSFSGQGGWQATDYDILWI